MAFWDLDFLAEDGVFDAFLGVDGLSDFDFVAVGGVSGSFLGSGSSVLISSFLAVSGVVLMMLTVGVLLCASLDFLRGDGGVVGVVGTGF